jgi:hypothetical protein
MRWDCKSQGCFNVRCRPKIEVFSDCFPGKINFGDVDGIVEYKGCFLLLEWKSEVAPLKKGQRLTYEALTRAGIGNTVLVVYGDAETMEVTHLMTFYDGRASEIKRSSLAEVKKICKEWVDVVYV